MLNSELNTLGTHPFWRKREQRIYSEQQGPPSGFQRVPIAEKHDSLRIKHLI